MPYEAYIERRFASSTVALITAAQRICDEYTAQGFTLTLRQLFYQFVARGLLPNRQTQYKRLGDVIKHARLAGLIDWAAIEDRTRNMRSDPHWDTPQDILEACAKQFAFDKWKQQPCRVEVWIEKDALIGVIETACRDFDVPYFACRGYTSLSEQWRAGKRFARYADAGQECVVLHLGDHDPSGIDMTRDNQDRLSLLSYDNVTVKRLALNWPQIEEYSPPPNPVKFTDSRASGYIANFGEQSWELDALEPGVIDTLIRDHIADHLDRSRWEASVQEEDDARARLQEIADDWIEE